MIIIVLILLVAVSLLFWHVLSNKTENVSKKDPYVAILNKDFVTKSKMIIVENFNYLNQKNEYPKEITDLINADTADTKNIILPIGSIIKFNKAIHFTSSVAGFKYAILLGKAKLTDSNIQYSVIYVWGTFKDLCISEPCNYWEYNPIWWKKK